MLVLSLGRERAAAIDPDVVQAQRAAASVQLTILLREPKIVPNDWVGFG